MSARRLRGSTARSTGRAFDGLRLLALLLAALLAGACGDSTPPMPPPPPGDGGLDGRTGTEEDMDGDGLCDITEFSRATDPRDTDSDDDGFSDYVEAVYFFDPLSPAEPDRDLIITLTEDPESSVLVPVEVEVRGEGEDYAGAFEGTPVPREPTSITASAFFDSATALFANPEDNVALLEPEAERFRGVVGTTRLNFEVRLTFGSNLPRSCLKAYPFRYNVRRSDGVQVGFARFVLVTVPVGQTISTGQWCAAPEPCF